MKTLSCWCFALSCAALPLPAQSLDEAYDVQILPGWRAADGSHVAAIEVTLAEGWKTYWRAPGDAGIPPSFDWSGSENLSGVEISWPTPEAMDQGGMQAIGYADRLTLPLRIAPVLEGSDVELKATLELGVCKDICIPVTVHLAEALPEAATKPDPRIVAAIADRPFSAREAGVGQVRCAIRPVEGGLGLRAEIELASTGTREVAVVETDNPKIWVAPAETTRQGARLIAETTLYHVDGRAFALNRSGVRITVLGDARAVDIRGCSAG